MSDWAKLAEPFTEDQVKQRQGPKQHQGTCTKEYGQCTQPHKMLSYVDARDVEVRLDDVLTPNGWDFQAAVAAAPVVHGRLVIYDADRAVVREDFGYPNGDDDAEPIKSAVSDALKRCAVQFGIGRHLYTDNKARRPRQQSAPAQPRQQSAPARPAAPGASTGQQRADTSMGLTPKQFFEAAERAGIDRKVISDTAKDLFGQWQVTALGNDQRAHLLEELTHKPKAPIRDAEGKAMATSIPEPEWEGLPV